MTRHEPPPRHALAAYLEGEVTPSEAAAIEAHLRDSGSARRQLEQLVELRRTLARPSGRLDAVAGDRAAVADLWRAIDAAPPERARRTSSRRARWGAWLGALAVAATAAVLLVRGDSDEFRVKSAADAFPEDRWVGIEVLQVGTDGVARPLLRGSPVHARDRLVFRYMNGGSEPLGFLMVFAIDASRQVHWYYPAYETAGSDPSSVSIRTTGRDRDALPDAIEHDLAAGPLVFYGLFTRAPLHVLDVEHQVAALIARQGWDADLPSRLPVDGAGQHIVRTSVVP